MDRRRFLRTSAGFGATAVAGLAGCLAGDDAFTVGTYDSMVETENPAGPWLKEAFEEEHPDVELQWATPEDGLNHYVQRVDNDVEVDADVYLGLNVDDLVRADGRLGEGSLFAELDRDRLERSNRLREDLEFGDPADRVVPFDTGYISLVYDETDVDPPETFEELTEPAYEGTILAQNAQNSDPGLAFLLWTIDAFGEDGYLEYWEDLLDNDVRILDSWWDSYSAYLEEERSIVVSYSTDQVHSAAEGRDLARHQIGLLDGQGYANPEGMAIFADSDREDLAYDFFDLVLSSEAQAEIATRNVQFPAVTEEYVDLEGDFAEYAVEPEESVTFTYDDLDGKLTGWIDDWAQQVAEQ